MQLSARKSERLETVIVIACPGQGSQTPGFLSEWISLPGAQHFLEEASAYSGVDLITHGTTSDADTIRDTRIAQPLIVAASMLAFRQLASRLTVHNVGIAGHSVGEFAAAAIAGVLSDADAMQLVGIRASAMAHAASLDETGMSAVVGGTESEVLELISSLGLTAANRNGPGQIVAAGKRSALNQLAEQAPRGTRVISLQVSGAFHTAFMQPAVQELSSAAELVTPHDPSLPLWTNSDGTIVRSGHDYLSSLVTQVSNPVRWDLCLDSFSQHNITGFIELAPAGALTGIAKRALKDVECVAVKTPSDLDDAVRLLSSASA